jgi:DNA-directed RNA polymerase subunit RPC12/RpoP
MGEKKSIEDMRSLAEAKGGSCLSPAYIRAMDKLRWRCSQGHEWDSRPNDVQSGNWCPYCAGRRLWSPNHTEEEARLAQFGSIAATRGGICLSTHYKNNNSKLLWRCADGHEWEAVPGSIQRGHWCPYCAGKRIWSTTQSEGAARIQECRSIAEAKGGICQSDSYLGVKTKHRWRCGEGHEWEATPDSIKRGSWCPYCARPLAWSLGKSEAEARLDECRSLAEAKSGICLSDVYVNDWTKLRWRCTGGHEWEASPTSVKQNHWCRRCATKKNADGLRGSLEECRALARSRGGDCLSVEYTNNNSKLLWRCSDGHEWEAVPGSIQGGTWCPNCSFGLNEEL